DTESQQLTAAEPARAARPRARRWLFRLLAILVGCSPLWGGELILRATSWRPQTTRDPFVGFQAIEPLFERVGDDYETAPARLEFFASDRFAAQKAASEYRIFCVGGSTVQGRPWSIETSFSNWLELTLRAADPDRTWEVVNCGGVSYASYRVAPIVEECLGYDPDLLVVYTGHNEFLEERSYPLQRDIPPWLARAYSAFESLRIVQWTQESTRLTSRSASDERTLLSTEVDALLDYRGGLAAYHRDNAWRESVEEHYEVNLRRIIALASQANVPVILVDPVSNERDCPPFKLEVAPELSDERSAEFSALWERAKAARGEEAERLLQQALRLDPEHAGAWFMLGQIQLTAKEIEGARTALRKAQDYDVCPLRMTEPLHAQLRRVAADTRTPMVDARSFFNDWAADGIPGDDQLVDHVHPSIDGHQRIAQLLAEQMIAMRILQPRDDWDQRRRESFSAQMRDLDEVYFNRGKQRLEGLRRWATGRAFKVK
ncbi:MAG: GDSL-type esterase/lipase family protein, partial [Pirellulaceae bacterium]|nr:GDSL-type esterase/lipase family protein [Pirellulaceae bacterium]